MEKSQEKGEPEGIKVISISELQPSNGEGIWDELQTALDAGSRSILIDLSKATENEIHPGILQNMRKTIIERGAQFRIVAPEGPLRSLLERSIHIKGGELQIWDSVTKAKGDLI